MSSNEAHPWHILAQHILHSAACSTSGVNQLLHQAAERCQRPQAPFAAITSGDKQKKRRKRKAKTDSASAAGAQNKATKRTLTPEERERIQKARVLRKLQKKRVRINGKRTNLLELAKQIVHDRKVKEVAGDEPQIRDMSHQELIDRIPGQDLRPGAFKMQLRAREEAQLPLELLARGMTFSPRPFFGNLLGGRRDLTFGIYGRADEARKLLDEKWSGLPLEYVMAGPEFFKDVLDNAARLELTVMAMPVRPLPLAALREDLCRRLGSRLGGGDQKASRASGVTAAEADSSAGPRDWEQLRGLAATFSDKRLRGSSFVDKQGSLIPDAHYIFSALPDSSLSAEVITPGNLRDRVTYHAGPWRSRKLTRAVFDMFLGKDPLDDQARLQAGQALVYLTNGFKLSPDPANPNQVFEGNDGQPMWPKYPLVKLEPSHKLFSLEGKGKTAQLVSNVERRRSYFAS